MENFNRYPANVENTVSF